jgi:hypothetical protein
LLFPLECKVDGAKVEAKLDVTVTPASGRRDGGCTSTVEVTSVRR